MLFTNTVGLLLIGAIVWWFWLYKPTIKSLDKQQAPVILVNNGIYQPNAIEIKAHQSISLQFLRQDASPCAEMVLFPTLDISLKLPVNQPQTIKLPELQPGKYPFHCQMQMYRGELHVI